MVTYNKNCQIVQLGKIVSLTLIVSLNLNISIFKK